MDTGCIDGGYYLEHIDAKLGTGDTARNTVMENIWQARCLGDGRAEMELLDLHDQPSGFKEIVEPSELGKRFVYQPEYQPKPVDPSKRKADQATSRAERHLAKQELFSAEYEFSSALQLDQDNVRANFGLGQTYEAQGETDKAREQYKKLVTLDAVLDPSYKHVFNETGIRMRKLGMFAEAIGHYQRALALERNDENLWFNLGRTLFEAGQKDAAKNALKNALTVNPQLAEARDFLCNILGEAV